MQDNPLILIQFAGLQWTPVHFSHRQSRYNLAVKKSGLESIWNMGGTVKTSMVTNMPVYKIYL